MCREQMKCDGMMPDRSVMALRRIARLLDLCVWSESGAKARCQTAKTQEHRLRVVLIRREDAVQPPIRMVSMSPPGLAEVE